MVAALTSSEAPSHCRVVDVISACRKANRTRSPPCWNVLYAIFVFSGTLRKVYSLVSSALLFRMKRHSGCVYILLYTHRVGRGHRRGVDPLRVEGAGPRASRGDPRYYQLLGAPLFDKDRAARVAVARVLIGRPGPAGDRDVDPGHPNDGDEPFSLGPGT